MIYHGDRDFIHGGEWLPYFAAATVVIVRVVVLASWQH